MFHNELNRFAPLIGLSPQTQTALELMLQHESGGRHDARPLRRVTTPQGAERFVRLSSAFSGMQIIDPTWDALQERYGAQLRVAGVPNNEQRQHPAAQARAAALLARDDLNIVQHYMRDRDFRAQPLRAGDQYLTHLLGGERAAAVLLANDDVPITRMVSPQVIANHKRVSFQGKPFGEFTALDLRNWAQDKMTRHIGVAASAAVDARERQTGQRANPSDELTVLLSYVESAGMPVAPPPRTPQEPPASEAPAPSAQR